MGRTQIEPRTFGQKLRAELTVRGMGVRTLARQINGENPERTRRALNKWIKDVHAPTRANRAVVTDALGMERGSLDPDDEEESDPVAALMLALRAFVRAELRQGASA